MTPEEAQKYISDLSDKDVLKLYEMLLDLEQKRQLAKG